MYGDICVEASLTFPCPSPLAPIPTLPLQLPALVSTQRRLKAEVMKERLLDINPALVVHEKVQFVEVDECDTLVAAGRFDYIIDCIDRCVCVYVCVCVRVRACVRA